MTRSQISYAINAGAANIKKHAAASTASIVTNTACILLLSIVLIIGANVRANMDVFQSKNTFLAFVDDRLSQSEARRLQTEIATLSGVAQLSFITKEEAYEQFVSNNTQLSSSYLDPSILRDRYAIRVKNGVDPKVVANQMLQISGISEVRLDEAVTTGLATIETGIAIIGSILTVLLLAICIILMTNTLNLTLIARKDELQVMQMMGAYDSFISLPFLFEGFIAGLSGSLLSFILTAAGYSVVGAMLNTTAVSLIIVLPFLEIAPILFAVSILLGIGIGSVGSLISVRRHLRSR